MVPEFLVSVVLWPSCSSLLPVAGRDTFLSELLWFAFLSVAIQSVLTHRNKPVSSF